MDVSILGLPEALNAEIKRIVDAAAAAFKCALSKDPYSFL